MTDKIKAAIFDMDGTLVDSMWIWQAIDVEYLKERNLPFPDDLKDAIEHLSFYDTAKYFKKRFNLKDSIKKITDDWTQMAYTHYANDINLKPHAREYLLYLKNKNIRIGLATSNCKLLVETALKPLGIYNLFDSITTTDEVERDKSFPDVYLLAAKRLGVLPQECVVFEDILPAVISAKKAGMTVVAVHDESSIKSILDIKSKADKFIVSYDEIIA
ncbi:HAD family phosphatase [Clostridium felsineum]|uniref:HAD family hydrolase n=1 Tax=Clostridium felsineum TaxID=36839 RepID=UPI00098C5B2F|nr:HAD family phosphatase [Clostridium felsineum]MCR3760814.1 HAD family phosphatase [Clostridium felsineum]URZ03364.1 Phosphorylated carbohydrates phosphatase [Clostridium felsineum]